MTIEHEEDEPRPLTEIIKCPQYGDIIHHPTWSTDIEPVYDWLTYDGKKWVDSSGYKCAYWPQQLKKGYYLDAIKSIDFNKTPAFRDGHTLDDVVKGRYHESKPWKKI